MVDKVVVDPLPYLRNIEDILGDARSEILTRRFPKYSALHYFIEELIQSVVLEDVQNTRDPWLFYLLRSNGFSERLDEWIRNTDRSDDLSTLIDFLEIDETYSELLESISHQVFYVIFSNRGTLRKFAHLCSHYVLDAAPALTCPPEVPSV
jgi:hypothetical protein